MKFFIIILLTFSAYAREIRDSELRLGDGSQESTIRFITTGSPVGQAGIRHNSITSRLEVSDGGFWRKIGSGDSNVSISDGSVDFDNTWSSWKINNELTALGSQITNVENSSEINDGITSFFNTWSSGKISIEISELIDDLNPSQLSVFSSQKTLDEIAALIDDQSTSISKVWSSQKTSDVISNLINDTGAGEFTTWSSQKISDELQIVLDSGAINDAATNLTETWSSQKISEELLLVGGGAQINDGETTNSTTWSSQKISAEIGTVANNVSNIPVMPSLLKGGLITSTGSGYTAFPACANGQTLEWDSTQTRGFKCVTPTVVNTPSVPLKGGLITSTDGVSFSNVAACADGEIIEWDSTEVNGFKCVTKPVSANNLLTTKGSLITHDGTSQVAFPACANGQIIEWDSTQPNGFKCITTPSGGVSSSGPSIYIGINMNSGYTSSTATAVVGGSVSGVVVSNGYLEVMLIRNLSNANKFITFPDNSDCSYIVKYGSSVLDFINDTSASFNYSFNDTSPYWANTVPNGTYTVTLYALKVGVGATPCVVNGRLLIKAY